MPSFDIVSEVNAHELANALDQANREISTRFDFKGTNTRIESVEKVLTVHAPAEFQVQQALDILQNRLAKRGIDLNCLKIDPPIVSGSEARQIITVREGIDAELARQVVKQVKDSKLKVQAHIQGQQVRVSGKKRDDLQSVITLLRAGKYEMPLQYVNFRD
jgi:uncharacterized protein YajQ (UPF0234 family)